MTADRASMPVEDFRCGSSFQFCTVLGSVVLLKLYQTLLDLKYVPQRWRTAKIVVLRKPNKPDYSVPKSCRPILLLETISKRLEAVVVRRLYYLAET
jgi:hypothetical protein